MIELFLSTDGKHTVHVAAQTPEEMMALAPKAQALYQQVLKEYGTKAQMWEAAVKSNGQGNGQAQAGRRIDTVEQAQEAVVPHCPMHQRPLVYRQGRRGPFWSCPTRQPDGRWCRFTQEVSTDGNGQAHAA